MTDPIAAWHAEHEYFSRLLGMLENQVTVFHGGEQPNYELMRDIVFYLRNYCDQVHERREDAAFAILAARDPGRQIEINRLLQEHRVIAHAGAALLDLLEEIVGGAFVPRAQVEAAASTYLVYYRNHIASEERQILPLAAQLLNALDWKAVAGAAAPAVDPLRGSDPQERFRELRREISREMQHGQ